MWATDYRFKKKLVKLVKIKKKFFSTTIYLTEKLSTWLRKAGMPLPKL